MLNSYTVQQTYPSVYFLKKANDKASKMYKEHRKKIYEVFLKCFQEIVLYRRLKVKSRENVKKYPPAPRTKQNKIAEINRTPLVTSVYSIHHCLNTTFALIGYFLLNYVTLYHVSDLD